MHFVDVVKIWLKHLSPYSCATHVVGYSCENGPWRPVQKNSMNELALRAHSYRSWAGSSQRSPWNWTRLSSKRACFPGWRCLHCKEFEGSTHSPMACWSCHHSKFRQDISHPHPQGISGCLAACPAQPCTLRRNCIGKGSKPSFWRI